MQPGQVKTRLETLAKLLVKDTEDSPEALQLARAAIKAVESTSGDPMFQQVLWGMTETGAELVKRAREVCDKRERAPRTSLPAARAELGQALQASRLSASVLS